MTNHIDQPTNLHTHGLHVSPDGNGDNPFITVEPGTSFDYTIAVVADHPTGTHWYHPHQHSTVADQIFAGLAGALLVDNGPDLPVTDDLTLVINACASRVLALRLDNHQLSQVALDGVFLPAPIQPDRIVLAPGNRADLLVRPTAGGQVRLITDPYDRGGTDMMGSMMDGAAATGPVTLATLAVTGPAATSPTTPATLPAPAVPSDVVARQRQLTFAVAMSMGVEMGMSFTIDGRTFDHQRDDQTVQLGTTEEWTITNTSPMDHPFQLHAWPFHRVLPQPPSARPPPSARWDGWTDRLRLGGPFRRIFDRIGAGSSVLARDNAVSAVRHWSRPPGACGRVATFGERPRSGNRRNAESRTCPWRRTARSFAGLS